MGTAACGLVGWAMICPFVNMFARGFSEELIIGRESPVSFQLSFVRRSCDFPFVCLLFSLFLRTIGPYQRS
jgi:hypothetical protein